MPSISVAVCTHNPRMDYLSRVLDALKAQKMPYSEWELLLIDNASATPVSGSVDLSWHPNGRHIREEELGIAAARLRSMRESTGELIVFFDDDNVPAEDYLVQCSKLFGVRTDLGAVSGRITAEYEAQPPEWFAPYEGWLAIRPLTKSTWSNFLDSRSEPITAGMCLRRVVANAFIKATLENPILRVLDRRGASLLSGEDIAIAKTAMKMGYSVGLFAELQMVHLIPQRRTVPTYLFSIYRHQAASGHLMGWVDMLGKEPIRLNWRMLLRAAYRFVKGNNITRRMVIEEFRGLQLARKVSGDWYKQQQSAATKTQLSAR
jgi:glycosyltransferase involved in cell wall biosynthesis